MPPLGSMAPPGKFRRALSPAKSLALARPSTVFVEKIPRLWACPRSL